MKKYLLAVLVIFLVTPTGYSQKKCASVEMIRQQMADDPVYAKKIHETEKSFANYRRQTGPQLHGKPSAIIVPVVVHVLYYTAEQNISDAQVQSQVEVLNEDYTATNSDYNNYDAGYKKVKGNADIKFCLVQVIHKQVQRKSFPVSDIMKYSKKGGDDAIDPMHILNIWVCDIGKSVLGFAYYPGISPEKFGVVCHTNAFGRGSQYKLFADYNLGRTVTHEMGHCLGLVHIWGDTRCGDDLVDDTPLHDEPNFGCPGEGHLSTCKGTPLEMWMNYMDYTDDRCMYFFSDGQTARADYFIDNDPQLNSIVNSTCTPQNISNKGWLTSASFPTKESNKNAEQFSIYPTISSGMLTLDLINISTGNAAVTVYNQNGVLMMRKQVLVTEGHSTNRIDVNRLANGVYFLQLYQGGIKQTEKFIVQH